MITFPLIEGHVSYQCDLAIAWCQSEVFVLFYFFKDVIYLFLERGGEGEREGEKHQCVVASRAPPAGNMTRNPGLCPDWESNRRPFGLQSGTQSTEPHQPGLFVLF